MLNERKCPLRAYIVLLVIYLKAVAWSAVNGFQMVDPESSDAAATGGGPVSSKSSQSQPNFLNECWLEFANILGKVHSDMVFCKQLLLPHA